MVVQLNPPIWLETPRGVGIAHLVIDYGPEHHLLWTVALDKGGECWTVANPEIKFQINPSMGRTKGTRKA